MYNPRLDKISDVLTNHSIKVQPGEIVLVEAIDTSEDMVISAIRSVRRAGGIPLVDVKQTRIHRELIIDGNDVGIERIGEYESYRMGKVQSYISIRGSENLVEMSSVPAAAMQRYQEFWFRPVHMDIRMEKKWVILYWGLQYMAQQAGMSSEVFENFYFDACTLDYSQMERALAPLSALMDATDEVHITGKNTDLRFSIKGIPGIPCAGECNIPDGECFTAPVRDSVNGTIHFNTPTIYQGTTFTDIRLRFKNGQVVAASDDARTYALNDILDTDEGARYVGEFSLALNPYIQGSTFNVLLDQKISGSLHMGLGMAYEAADNGVRSNIHWDLVMIQTPKYGGGEIRFDGTVIRRDGKFVHPAFEALNPENLK